MAHPTTTATTWAESEYYAVDSLEPVETSVMVVSALHRSRDILIERSTDKRDYKKFCEVAWDMLLLDGKWDRAELQACLDISASTLTQMINEFRAVFGSIVKVA